MYNVYSLINDYTDLVESWRKMRVNKLEEKVPQRFDLVTTCHVNTARSKWGHKSKVSLREGKQREKKGLLNPVLYIFCV